MKPDQEKVRDLLMDTVGLLCKNGLIFKKQLKIEGLLGITVDNTDVFIVHIDEVFPGSAVPKISSASSASDDHAAPVRMVPAPVAEYNQVLVPSRSHTVPLRSIPKPGRKRLSSGKMLSVKRERAEWREDAIPKAVAASAWNETLERGLGGSTEHCSPNGDDGVYLKSEADDQSGKMDDELMWMNAINDSNNSQCHIDLVSNSAQHFDGASVLEPFDETSHNESFVANVSDLSDGLNCSGPQKKQQECDSPEMKPDGSGSRCQRRSSGRRRSARSEITVPFTDTGSSVVLADNDDGNNWDAEVKGQYGMATEIDWDNENGLEEDQSEQQQFGRNEVSAGFGDIRRRQRKVERGKVKQSAQNIRNYSPVDLLSHPMQPMSQAAVRPFICQYEGCGRAFIQKKHMTWHQREKHGRPYGIEREFSFPCQFRGCQRVFYKVGYLRNHMESEHGYDRTWTPQFAQV